MVTVSLLLLPACVFAATAVAWSFPSKIEAGSRRRRIAWMGSAFFVAAAVADVGATLWHSPTLDQEAHPLVRSLLLHWPLSWVLVGAGIFQLAFLSLTISLWLNLLARWPWYLDELRARGRTPLWLAMSGARRGSWTSLMGMGRQVVVGLAAFAFYLPWVGLGRMCLAMEWMGWVPTSRWVMPLVLLACAFVTQWLIVRQALGDAPVQRT